MDPVMMNASTGVSFKLVLNRMLFDEAEEFCNGCCGHLAAYSSQQEQYDAENYYVSGALAPGHVFAMSHLLVKQAQRADLAGNNAWMQDRTV